MAVTLEFIFKNLFSLVLLVFYIIHNTIRFFIPYKHRAKDISKEIILVTGSGSGLGKSLSKKLAKLGAILVLWDIDENAIKQTKTEIEEDGGKAYAFKCDLSSREEIYRIAEETKNKVGDITMLVNNAGIVTGKKFLECDDKLIEKTFQVNTISHFWTTKAFLRPMLEKNHGHVVTVASMAGHFGTSGLCDYSASKFGAVGFDESLRNELVRLGKNGVKTTCVCPYYINTGMFDGVKSSVIPILEPEYVTDKILEAILTNQEILCLPRFMYLMLAFKNILPLEALTYLGHKVVGVNNSMDEFKGRKKLD